MYWLGIVAHAPQIALLNRLTHYGCGSIPRNWVRIHSTMRLKQVTVSNFRLLADAVFSFEETTTVIVGRNNSGKTSLTELFRRMLESPTLQFRFEDFSLSTHDAFWEAYDAHRRDENAEVVRALVPSIEITLVIDYGDAPNQLGALADCIIDLNPAITEAHLRVCYALRDGRIDALFGAIQALPEGSSRQDQQAALCRVLRERTNKEFSTTLFAIDPGDPTNVRELTWAKLKAIVGSGFINAQRGLDDVTHKDKAVLGRILEQLFKTAREAAGDSQASAIAAQLQTAVQQLQQNLEGDFNAQLSRLLPAFSVFGYPGLADPRLRTETTLDVERLLSNHTRVNYEGVNGINLPETYNGLGSRNLIFILLSLLEFYKMHCAMMDAPHIHLVFIEEPEVHLHPQMQEVFIEKLHTIGAQFAAAFGNDQAWPVQFVVTTHSSHIANRADFAAIRYFLAKPAPSNAAIRQTTIKSLRDGLQQSAADSDFLHKYMTLTQCDLLFADKAVLIEGASERLMLPEMIRRLEVGAADAPRLSTQYLSILEVGGAYAHLFLPLLDFLELPSLVVTDLDSVKREGSHLRKCRVSEGERTSNECIRQWFSSPDVSPAELVAKPAEAKVRGRTRIAYQISEGSGLPCGRSFEDAFILANHILFDMDEALEEHAWEQAATLKKSDFALKYATEPGSWSVPKYIAEGLAWLASTASDGTSPIPLAPIDTAIDAAVASEATAV